ncbi:condensation domain-containing protein, partial [Pseudoalteromonas sp. P1-9]|uniref:condensation domain-containing protein n=1 Tax=Pseudoalteromonas sp. P1-9 TaxID=1710354 RepID=UPI001F35D2D2
MSRVSRESPLALSYSQQRLWFIDRFSGGSSQYNMPGALKVSGYFDVALARQALAQIIVRHEVLRTVYHEVSGNPVQVIQEVVEFDIDCHDLSGLVSEAQSEALSSLMSEEASRVFDLSSEVLLRASYVHLSDEDGVLLFNMHHIASDGWSMGILVSEFSALYEGLLAGKVSESILPPLAIQYADYAHWQRTWLTESALASQLSYWQTQLDDCPMVHSLP